MTSKTAPAFPGWYVEFQANVLRNLPRPPLLDQSIAENWNINGQKLKKSLSELIIPGDMSFRLKHEVRFFVPENFDNNTILSRFSTKHSDWYPNLNPFITDENFHNPSERLIPNVEYIARIFSFETSSQRTVSILIDFLQRHGAILAGAQGLVAVYEYGKRETDPKTMLYYLRERVCSFDKKEFLWKDPTGYPNIPWIMGAWGQEKPEFGLFQWKPDDKFNHQNASLLMITEASTDNFESV